MHPEITMPKQEFCNIVEGRGDEKLSEWMENEVALRASQPSSVPPQKYGIKCPQMIRRTQSIENLMKLSDSTRYVGCNQMSNFRSLQVLTCAVL
jgi:hypothetical protein